MASFELISDMYMIIIRFTCCCCCRIIRFFLIENCIVSRGTVRAVSLGFLVVKLTRLCWMAFTNNIIYIRPKQKEKKRPIIK